jgi:UDP-2,4-diacetamido-2,4,6-trideoxy-beta-L-altropyranose hydrolase
MRCLTLATGLKQRGAHIRFISRRLPVHLCDMLAARGMELASLNVAEGQLSDGDLAHAHWLETTQAQDAQETLKALSGQQWDWLIVDHYALDNRWESALRGAVNKIMVIDDLADRQHDCNMLLDQNFYADMQTRYTGKVPLHSELLMGPYYALLRDEFRKLRKQVGPRSGQVKRILVFFGGVDADNYTGRAIEALVWIDMHGLHVDVVIGAQHPCLEQIRAVCVRHGFVCHVQTDKMGALMADADLAIGAGGSATWERCCLGLPAVLVALADNQINIAQGVELVGAGIYLGTSDVATVSIMRQTIASLVNTQGRVEELSAKAYSLVDGLGIDRVCERIGC